MQIQPELAKLETTERQATIMIVEDDSLQSEMLSHCLQKLGFDTIECDQVTTVRETAIARKPDLILLDICLPDGDGLELCEMLVDDPTTANIPIIIVSGHEDSNIVRQARRAGCQFFLKKPYDPNTLLILIENAIDNSGCDDGKTGLVED